MRHAPQPLLWSPPASAAAAMSQRHPSASPQIKRSALKVGFRSENAAGAAADPSGDASSFLASPMDGLRDKRDFSLGRKMKPRLLINCARRSRGRTARNRFLFSTDLPFLSHQKIPTILEWRPPWPLLRPLRRIWKNGYHSLAWHPRAKLPPGP